MDADMEFDSGPSAHQVFQEAFEEQQQQQFQPHQGMMDGDRKMLYVPSPMPFLAVFLVDGLLMVAFVFRSTLLSVFAWGSCVYYALAIARRWMQHSMLNP